MTTINRLAGALAIALGWTSVSEASIHLWNVSAGGNSNHYQQVVLTGGAIVDWAAAKTAAESLTFLGVSGHLVTITSAFAI